MAVIVVDVEALEWSSVAPSRAGTGEVRVKAFATGCSSIPAAQLVEYGAGRTEVPHRHNEDEIFYVLDGEMRIDGSPAGRGAVVVIGAHTTYGLSSEDGCRFLRLRAAGSAEGG